MAEMYDDEANIKTTFDENNLPPYLLHAQWAEMVELKKALSEISARQGHELAVLDIGIGNARVPQQLSNIREIWDCIGSYQGIDVAQNCIELSEKAIEAGLDVTVQQMDGTNIDQLPRQYDVIMTTWFTAGNFYPTGFSFDEFKPGQDMTHNTKFEEIFKKAYEKLLPGGEIIIGSAYIDNEPTRLKQEEAYRGFGWNIITDERDCFTASKEGWWSQRFTEQRIKDYIPTVHSKNISFISLDTYDYAMMVRMKK